MKYIIAYDLGTGGTKASLFDQNGQSVADSFTSCETFFPKEGWHEQRPEDWWENIKVSTKKMLQKSSVDKEDILALAISGHSLGVVPIGKDGSLLREFVPIWSDHRASKQADNFFQIIPQEDWYTTTGNGFPPPIYSIFKIMWYKEHKREMYDACQSFIGTKDYINYKMTGVLCTDRSYASGSGVYSLEEECYVSDYIKASGVDVKKLPTVYPSTHILGTVLPNIAVELGLSERTKVCAGGVDNACMALGAACIDNGDVYTSLGSSAWIAVSSDKPIINVEKRPYVFAHCLEGKYVSATSIFSAGNSFRWVRDTICQDLVQAEEEGKCNSYHCMDELAKSSPIGAHKLIFNPSLAGGSGLDKSAHVSGCFTGLALRHTRADLIRATLEGVCFNLRLALDVLEQYTTLRNEMLMVGGGAKSMFWRQLFAEIYNKEIVKTNIGEDAGSLGAATVAAVGIGLWEDWSIVKQFHKEKTSIKPPPDAVSRYQKILPLFSKIAELQSEIGEEFYQMDKE